MKWLITKLHDRAGARAGRILLVSPDQGWAGGRVGWRTGAGMKWLRRPARCQSRCRRGLFVPAHRVMDQPVKGGLGERGNGSGDGLAGALAARGLE